MFGRSKAPPQMTGETIVYRWSDSRGRIGPPEPLSNYMDQVGIDTINGFIESSGLWPDDIVPGIQGAIHGTDMSDPETQRTLANLHEGLKRVTEERAGNLALQQTLE